MAVCNFTLTDQSVNGEVPLWSGITFHRLGLVLSATFALISVCITFWLIFRHATHYLKPWEQKHIIRILLMIPIYSTVSFLSYYYYKHAIYFEVMRDCYEAFAIASFFTLLCHYIAPNLHEQKDFFRQLTPKNWFWAVFGMQKLTGGQDRGPLRKPRSGLTWFNVIWIGVFQYCFIRITFTIVSVTTQAAGRYCESSLNPAFAHIWVMVFEGGSVSVAMFCLIQFYLQLKVDLAEHRPFLKVICIKLVIFFSFWQSLVISFLSSSNGPLKPTSKIYYNDIKVGIPSMLLCVEMAIFAVMHLFAFPWKEYDLSRSAHFDPYTHNISGSGPGKLQYRGFAHALLDAFNPWDIVKASARGARWLVVGRRHRTNDSSYGTKLGNVPTEPQYNGVAFAATGDAAVETLRPPTHFAGQVAGRQGSVRTLDSDDGDRAGLLSHAQTQPSAAPPRSLHPAYRSSTPLHRDESTTDLGSMDPHADHAQQYHHPYPYLAQPYTQGRSQGLGYEANQPLPRPTGDTFGPVDGRAVKEWGDDGAGHRGEEARDASARGPLSIMTNMGYGGGGGVGDGGQRGAAGEWDVWGGAQRAAGR